MSNGPSRHDQILKAASKEADGPVPLTEPDPDPKLDLSEDRDRIEVLKQQLKEDQDKHQLRLDYTLRIFVLMCLWLACVAIAVFMSGFDMVKFKLPDKVLITFIISTTASGLGLFFIVAKWMFPKDNKSS